MRTKRITAFLFAAILVFESIMGGMVPVSAQVVSEAAVIEATETTVVETDVADEPASEAEVVHSGTDGALYWEIDENGHLTISGTGDYEDRLSLGSQDRWDAYKDEIKSATVNVTGITTTSMMFAGCDNMKSVDLSGLEMVNVLNTSSMFYGCSSLQSLDISKCNISRVEDMSYMFFGCTNLKEVIISTYDSQINTSNVTTMNSMFSGCSSLESLDISKFDTNKVTDMESMFEGCDKLRCLITAGKQSLKADMELPVPNSNYSWKYQPTGEIVTVVDGVGTYIREVSGTDGDLLWSIDADGHLTISGNGDYAEGAWLTYKDEIKSAAVKVTGIMTMQSMFSGCSNMTTLDLTELDASKVTNMYCAFAHCSGLTELDLTGLDTSNVESMWYMFLGCSGLKTLKLTGTDTAFNTSIVTSMYGMFSGCSGLTELDLTGLDTGNVKNMSCMFTGCKGLTGLKLTGLNTEKVETMFQMFYDCKGLTSLDLSELNTENVTDMGSMFYGCSGLKTLKLHAPNTKFNTNKVTNMFSMFDGCSSLESLKLAGPDTKFDTSSVTSMGCMFRGCSSLKTLDLKEFDTSLVTSMSQMFSGCDNLTTLIAPENRTATDMELPAKQDYIWKYQPSGETVSLVTTAGTYTRRIGAIDGALSWDIDESGRLTISGKGDYKKISWLTYKDEIKSATVNVTGITSLSRMFEGCIGLTELDLTGLDTSAVTDADYMLFDCDNLTTIIASGNKSSVDMELPVTNHIWKYQPTGTSVVKITEAGTYVREEELGEQVPPSTPNTPSTPGTGGDLGVSDSSGDLEPKVETKVEIKADGSVTKTETTTEPSGEKAVKVVSTSKDQEKETIVDMKYDASAQLTDVAIEVIHVVKSSKMTINLKELKTLVDQVSLGNTAYIQPLGSSDFHSQNMDTVGACYEEVQDSLGVAQKRANVSVKVSAKSSSGQKKYSVAIKKTDLTKKKFVVFASDKNNNAVMVNTKKNTAKVNKKKDLTLKIAKSGNYQVQNTKDAAKTNKKIIKTVKPKKSNVTVKKGKSTSFKLATKCNKDNIQKITYSSNSSSVKVNKKGKMQAKSKGTAKVTATVTMKNGAKKKIKMKVKVS